MDKEVKGAWIIRRISKPEEQIVFDSSPYPEDRLFGDHETAEAYFRVLQESGQINNTADYEFVAVDHNAKPI